MSDNNVAKGAGLLGLIGLIILKTCRDPGADRAALHEGEEVVAHDFFACNKAHPPINEIPPIKPPPDVPIVPPDVPPKIVRPDPSIPDDRAFISKNEDGGFTYHDMHGVIVKQLDEITADNKKILIVDGNLTKEEIKVLNNKGIQFICNKDVYEEQKNIGKFQVLLIFSDEVEKLKNLYSINDDQANDLISYASKNLDAQNIKTIDTQEGLSGELSHLRDDGVTPIVIFNNIDNTIFGTSISDLGIKNVITCNSSELGDAHFLTSLSFIGVRNVISSLNQVSHDNLFDFYKDFSLNYSKSVKEDKQYLTTVVIGGALLTAGTGGLIIYYTKND